MSLSPDRIWQFHFSGVTPMIMHADDVEAADSLKVWRQDSANNELSTPGDDRSPPWTYLTYMYAGELNGISQIIIPAANVMAALRFAGSQIKMKGAKTFKKLSQSGISMVDEYCMLKVGLGDGDKAPIITDPAEAAAMGVAVGQPHPGFGLRPIMKADLEALPPMSKFRDHVLHCRKLGFQLYAKRAPVGASKHVRVRPRFEKWEVTGRFKVSAAAQDSLDENMLSKLFVLAGEQSGLGDWRPSSPKSPGPFGQFKATLS